MPTSGSIGFLSAFGIGVTGQNSTIHSNAVATDPAGDTYITGSFRGTVTLSPNSSSATYTSNNTQDTFVAKYGPTGLLVWATTFVGQSVTNSGGGTTTAVSQGSGIAVDGSGNVFVAGSFSGTVDLTGASGTSVITTPSSTTEIYLAKLNASGSLTWVDSVAGTQYDTDEAYAVALDGSGGAVIAGSFQDSATFGTTTLTSGGVFEAFAARVNSSGTFQWAVASQGTPGSNAEIHGVAVDASGNVDLAGFFSGTVDFNPGSATANLTSAGSDDAVLWKLDPNGNFVWARDYGSTDYDAATAITVDPSGNIYATGAFSDTVNFGSSAATATLTAGPIFDTFVLKVDPNGNEVWVKGFIGPGGWSKGQGIALDPLGNLDIDGTFQGQVDFDPNGGTDNLTSVGNTDVFVTGLDPNGNLLYALQAGLTNFNAALGIAVNASGTVSITGTDTSAISFGSINVPAVGVASVFVSQVNSLPPPSAPSAPVLEASSNTGSNQANNVTSDTTPVFDVNTATASDTVELLRNGMIVGHRTGPGAIQDPGPIADGTYTYTAEQVSPSGVTGPAGPSTSVTILTKPPAAPPAPNLYAADDTGVVGDGITRLRQPRLSVVAAAQTTVTILTTTGQVLGSVYAASAGTYLITPTQALADGVYIIDAQATDLAGNIGPIGATFSLTIMANPIPTPSTPTVVAADISGAAGSSYTNVRQPRITGTAEAGKTVDIETPSGTILATTTAASNGSYTVMIASPLSSGVVTLDAVATDVAGNLSSASATLSLTIDDTPPLAPTNLGLLATDDSGTVGDGITNVRQPHLTGMAEVGSTVQIFDTSGNNYGSAVVPSSGVFSIQVNSSLSDGTYVLEARSTDLANNVGPFGATFTLTIMANPIPTPATPTVVAADISGAAGSSYTNVRQPRITGTAEAGKTVDIETPSGTILATTTAASNGSYTVMIASPLSSGVVTLDAVATDVAGNLSSASATLSLTIDYTPPLAPTNLGLLATDDSGTVGDGITNVRQPHLTGTAQVGSTVQIVDATGKVYGSVVVPSTGVFSVQIASPLSDGTYALQAKATDQANNVSPLGTVFNLTIMATPIPTPSTPTVFAADISGAAGSSITNVRQPRITGFARANTFVTLYNSTGTFLGSSTSASDGSYTIKVSSPLNSGVVTLDVVASDVASNVSPPSPTLSFTIDDTPPVAPSVLTLLSTDDSGVLGDDITYVRQPHLTGTAEVGATVNVVDSSGKIYGSTVVPSSGKFTVMIAAALSDGSYTLEAQAIDTANNVGPVGPSVSLTIMANPIPTPATPTVVAADISGAAGSSYTNVRQPRITGTAEAGKTVDIETPSGTILATTTAASNGSYTVMIASPLSSGVVTLDAVATDVAGNLSSASATLSLTIDYTPPLAPTNLGLLATDDSGTVGDGITNVRQPHLTGTAQVGSTVQIVDATGKVYGSAVVPSSGVFSVQIASPLSDGTYALQAKATDQANNVGPVGSSFTLTILGTAPATPAAPTLLAADDSGGPGLTNVRQPRLTGTGAANGSVKIIGPTGTVYATASTGSNGSYVAQVSSPLGDGTYSLRVVTTDVAGNVSAAGATFSLTILATPPAAPTTPVLFAADDSGTVGDGITNVRQPRLAGTATPGLTIRLVNASNTIIGTLASVPSIGSFAVMPSAALADGTYPLRFVAVDAAGNVSQASGVFNLVIMANPLVQLGVPSLLPADDTGVLKDGMTSVTRPRITGTAVAGDQVAWISASGSVLGSTTVASNGTYVVQPNADLPNGTSAVRVRETDAAGNVSALSLPFALTIRVSADDDFADGESDYAVYDSATNYYYIVRSGNNGLYVVPFGIPGDVPVNGDFFGDGYNDLTLYRPSNSTFYSYDFKTNAFLTVQLGQSGDIPVPADFDGDGKTDFAVYQPNIGTWFVKDSSTNTVVSQGWGIPGDIPVPADYLGLGHADFAVYRPSTSTFYAYDPPSGGYKQVTLGIPGDIPVSADYEGIGHADFAVFQPNNLSWSILLNNNTVTIRGWGIPGDTPLTGDYFGDGRTDLTVYRASTSTFFTLSLASGAVKVQQVGISNVSKAVLTPITSWFTFGSTAGGKAVLSSQADSGSTLDFAVLPESTDSTIPSTASSSPIRKVSAIDQALDDLTSLDDWHPGS